MLRSGAGERVDRLIVVTDDAEIVAVAEPVLEQALLQQVDVLILVDGERAVLRAEGRHDLLVVLEQTDRAFEQILEVEEAVGFLTTLVVDVDARHQVGGNRRIAVDGGVRVLLRPDAAVLRPLDLGGEVTGRPELVRRAQLVPDLAKQQRLRRQDPADLAGREVTQLPQRCGVERARADASDPECGEARAQLASRLVGERHRHDLRRVERTGRNLLRDAPRDRRRLACPCAGEDAHRAAHGLGRAALLGVQAIERVHRCTVAATPDGNVTSVNRRETPRGEPLPPRPRRDPRVTASRMARARRDPSRRATCRRRSRQ